jgi:class 3 adenylate cyclase/tetratricopeptide (TPR) repeat protein
MRLRKSRQAPAAFRSSYAFTVQTCHRCGHANPEGARFCNACAAPLAETPGRQEERKVVTVLFCDLVDFTARAEALDPEDVEAILAPYHAQVRTELERFGGTVEKFIGDAVMGVFGAPTAHEDDPERAVRAALAIRDWAEHHDEVALRIGINTGEALVSLGARPEQGESMVKGDVVNTAARLQTAAPTNRVLVGETTYRATRRVIEYREAEQVEAKGKAAPVAVWEAVEASSGIEVERAPDTPLVGREIELAALVNAFDRVKRERQPQFVTLVGVPGIGKSRLVYELGRSIDHGADLVHWCRGRSLSYGEGVSFWALGEIVKSESGILESDTAEVAHEKLRSAVRGLVDPADADRVVAQLRALVGAGPAAEFADDRREDSFAAWRLFLEALAEDRPLVLVLEDVHWADDAMLDFVDYLVDWVEGVPMLIVCTARAELLERRPAWGGGRVNTAAFLLSPLSEEETARLVHSLLGRSVLSADLQTVLLERAGGNPLYAEEFARLVEEGRGGVELPETVQGIIAARLDVLSAAEKELLLDAAVAGRTFWAGELEAIGKRERTEVEQLLHSIARREMVRRDRRSAVAGDTQYTFRHALVRDVAYGQIPRSSRAEMHRRAAEWIESLGRAEDHAELLAHHYRRALELTAAAGLPPGELADKARAALCGAGDRASDLNAFAAAARFYESALALWPADGDGERNLYLLRTGRALRLSNEPRAAGVLEEAARELSASGDVEGASEAELLLGAISWNRGERDDALQHLERAQRLIEHRGATAARARVLSEIARFHMLNEESEAAIASGREALAIAEPLGLTEVIASTLDTIGVARHHAGDPGGREDVERGIQTALEIGSPEAARAYNNLATMHFSAGDLRGARTAAREGIRVAERFGNAPIKEALGSWEGDWAYADGRWDECLRILSDFIAACEAGTPHTLESWTRMVRGSVRLARSDDEGALEDGRRGLAAARRMDSPQVLPDALAFLVRVHVELGHAAEAQEPARELVSYLARGVGGTYFAPLRLAWVAPALGLADEARRALDRLPPAGRWLEAAHLVLNDECEGAADVLAESGSLPEEAYARLRAAERLVDAGRAPEAGNQLQRSLAFWQSVGATRYVDACNAVARSGPDGIDELGAARRVGGSNA